jgi:8-oxo-dGTP diphosphatase
MSVCSQLERELLERAAQDGVQKLAVGGAIVGEDGASILILTRHPSDFMPGLEELPSGGVQEKETLYEALAREIEEETGLELGKVEGYLNHFDYRSSKGRLARQFNFLVSPKEWKEVTLVPNEHSSFSWRSLSAPGNLSEQMLEVCALVRARLA